MDDYEATIRRYYPDAASAASLAEQWLSVVHRHTGLTPEKILVADSLCSDDVNWIQYPAEARRTLGPFMMGGLDGFPFTGLTGMKAFVHHVPTDGAVSILYGPHIGISSDGSLGEVLRVGQQAKSKCCGACHAGLEKLLADRVKPGELDEMDYQQGTLEQILLSQRPRIVAAKLPLMEATQVIYEAIDARIDALVQRTSFPCRYVFRYGCVVINTDSGHPAYVSPRSRLLFDRHTATTVSLE